ncbi:DUF998 domain-containing protein [Blastococcus xanthinilyticus]|uniref:Putative membrane protein n=1 Tax=Blastococcus xanthinilyticus TaxID=1564164 RepID=A0A5S5CNF9_9ACTN|nr:DUF998 domain-containing protein [Blastococcus xanthinilyticus]TYP84591.1 putative membrane protein [Blastococcus xanthinilyticus]
MGPVTSTRLRWGALTWLLTLQFFVAEAVAEARYAGAYSRVDDVISALGASDSPARQLMNASFVVQAALFVGGALLLRPALRGGAARVVPVLLGAAALGVLLVGVFPTDGNGSLHAVGAVLYLVGGGLGLVALAYAVRPHSETLGTIVVLLGMLAIATTIFFLTGVTGFLGEGGTERAAAYPLPLGLALTGVVLWWTDRRGEESPDATSLRAERAREQTRRAEQARARDAALESAGRRDAGTAGGTTPGDTDPDDTDPEDYWGPSGRRG